jgi:hypothetical protein
VLLATGDLAGARDGFAKALAILVPVVGEAHPNVAVVRKSLAHVDAKIAAKRGGEVAARIISSLSRLLNKGGNRSSGGRA